MRANEVCTVVRITDDKSPLVTGIYPCVWKEAKSGNDVVCILDSFANVEKGDCIIRGEVSDDFKLSQLLTTKSVARFNKSKKNIPLNSDQLAEISVRYEKLVRDFEDNLIEDIARRIAKAGEITSTAEWQIRRLKEIGYATEYIEKQLAIFTQKSEQEIEWLFFEAAQVSDDFYKEVYAAAGKPFVPLEDNPYLQQYVNAGIAQTKGEMYNYTQSMGFAVIGKDGKTHFKWIAQAYQDALDLAQEQVATGAFDYNKAVRNAVKTLTDSGLRNVDYISGTTNHLDVAARRAILTGVSQMTGKIAEHNAKELETDVVEVSAHAGARPDHAKWQGRWYSLSGKTKEYPSLVTETGYGTGAGLKGWNCHHDFYPVIPGISEPSYTEEELRNIDPPPIEYNGKIYTYYECTQKQRQMETAMRKTKREIIGAKGSGDDKMFTAKSIRLKSQKAEYEKFSKRAGLLTQNERTQVYGFGRSEAAQASAAARRGTIDNSSTGGIISVGVAKEKLNSNDKELEYFDSKEYRQKFKGMGGNLLSDNAVYNSAVKAIEANYGGKGEDMYLIDKVFGNTRLFKYHS